MHTTDIVIRSYVNDFGWLAYALKSLHQRASGFRHIHVVVPQGDAVHLAPLTKEIVHQCPHYSDDYLGQQVTKMMADTYTDADFILHFDSDTVFTTDVTPADFIVEGKPIIYLEPYEKIGREPWQPIVSEILGWTPDNEFMRRFPFIYPRWFYGEVRRYLEQRHGKSLEEYVVSRPYRSFSEFNVLGAYAWEHCRDSFTWKDPFDGLTHVRQFRSWDGFEEHKAELESLTS